VKNFDLNDVEVKAGLPHLFAYDWYEWAWEFFTSTNRENFLCAANQLSKSSTQIRKCIDWATDIEKWPSLWAFRPTQFWYLYPDGETATLEFETKWMEFLPKGWAKDHPQYGWEVEYDKGKIKRVKFNTGVQVIFKFYTQRKVNLQAGTVFAIFCDEELPIDYLGELQARLNATDGYFHMVFTATLGQEHWRRCIEEVGKDLETHKGAWKKQVSLFDCMHYKNGKRSHWTAEKIQRAIDKCATKAEELKRVWGKFVLSGGLVFEGFDVKRNTCPAHLLPKTWIIYTGVDVGSGGEAGHPAATIFVAVDPAFTQGRVFRGWRGDGVVTTAGDILDKYKELKGKLKPMLEQYDHQAKDFFEIACRKGENFSPADKSRDKGILLLNTLFKHGMLKIYIGEDPELDKLVVELCSLKADTPKTKAKDDFCDALRYAVNKIPWDWSILDKDLDAFDVLLDKTTPKSVEKSESQLRREYYLGSNDRSNKHEIEEELAEWNDLYGT